MSKFLIFKKPQGKKKKTIQLLSIKRFQSSDLQPETEVKASHLCDTDKNVGGLLLQEVMEGIFPGFLEQLMFDGDERCLTETLQGQNHPIGQKTVHQDPAVTATISVQAR